MTTLTSPAKTFRYSTALVALHWFMALLFVAVYASIELRVLFPKGTDMRDLMKALHFMFGLGVLLMVLARLGARWASPKPQQGPTLGLETWAHRMASLGHLALYALMLVMPVMGWLAMPPLMAPNKTWAHDIKELHETVGVAGYWLIGIHVAAALGHHYVLKDGLLSRMSVLRSPLAA
jgi:cytochrome b561